MTKKELWKIFMKTGRVSDYLNYKNASESQDAFSFLSDEEISEEFAQEYINNYDGDFPDSEEYRDDNQNGRFSDS